MSKQTFLDAFIKKKQGPNPSKHAPKHNSKGTNGRNKHNSSREDSEETVRLPDDEPEVNMEVFEQSTRMVCEPLILLTPAGVLHFESIRGKLQRLEKSYGKEEAMAFIEGNLRFHKVENIRNLDAIADDDFWGLTLPKLIQLLLTNLPTMGCRLPLLRTGSSQVAEVTRLQALLLVGCMFLGIMPKQMHEDVVSMGELMTLRENEHFPKKAVARREKLRCFMTYLQVMTKREELHRETFRIQRTANRDMSYLQVYNMDRQVPLRSVDFQLLEDKTIEDYCGSAIMVDFANKHIGGGVLKNGCVQEEILFAIFPELLVTRLLVSSELEDNEAVIVYGARRFSEYEGYSDSFKFKREHPLQRSSIAQKSIFVAIDATDLSRIPSETYQYSKKGVRRELHKAFAGFEGAALEAGEEMPICTGKWGCGAFRGDEDLKFLIQWLAASEANREMLYITDSREKLQEYSMVVKELRTMNTLDLLSLLDEFYRMRAKIANKLNVLDYIKQFA